MKLNIDQVIAISIINGTIVVPSETYATNRDGIFAGGEVVTGANTVADAMSSGKRASEMIDKYMRVKKISKEYQLTRPSKNILIK